MLFILTHRYHPNSTTQPCVEPDGYQVQMHSLHNSQEDILPPYALSGELPQGEPVASENVRPTPSVPPSSDLLSRWWEAQAEQLLSTSSRLDHIILVCEQDLFSNPQTPIQALCKQPLSRLDDLCKTLGEHGLLSSDKPTKAEQIVRNLRGPVSTAPAWDGSWLISSMDSPMDVGGVAAKLDWSICSVFCKVRHRAWVKMFLGYGHCGISAFLDAVLNLRNGVAQFVQSAPLEKWESLEVVSKHL
jgi:hypothetical protein